MHPGLEPWSKAGLIIKASTRQGSAYAAMMVTGGHGVRMQYDYTQDVAGPARRRHRGVPALAAADPVRRHDHRLRLGRRHALDAGRHRHPARAAVDRAGRAVRHLPGLQRDDRPGPARDQRHRRPHPGHRRPRPRQPARRRPAGAWSGTAHRRRPQRRAPGQAGGYPPGRRHVHGDRVRRHRAGRARRRGPRPDRRAHPGGRVRRADRRGRGGDDVHHRRVPARPDPHHLRRQPAAGAGAGREGHRDRRGHLRRRAGGRRRRGPAQQPCAARPTATTCTR